MRLFGNNKKDSGDNKEKHRHALSELLFFTFSFKTVSRLSDNLFQHPRVSNQDNGLGF